MERPTDQDESYESPEPGASGAVVVRRRAAMLLVMGALASGLAIAFLWRATGSGSWVDALVCAVLAAMGAGYLTALIDARSPLLVVDHLGVRIRIGREWRGLPWESVDRMWLLPREGLMRDRRLVVVPSDLGHVVEGLDRGSMRSLLLTQRLHGAPLALPVGATTVVTAGPDLLANLRDLAAGQHTVIADGSALESGEAPLEDTRLTDEHVARREAVVRALPGVTVPETTEVSHVALRPDAPDAPDAVEATAADEEPEQAGEEFSVLARIFDLGAAGQSAAAPVEEREQAASEADLPVTLEAGPDEATAYAPEAAAWNDVVAVDADAASDDASHDDLSDDLADDLVDEPAARRESPLARWRRARQLRRELLAEEAAQEAALLDSVNAVAAEDETDVEADELAEPRLSAADDVDSPAHAPTGAAPAGSVSSAASVDAGEPGGAREPGLEPEAAPPGMVPAALVSVAPLVPSRSSARRVEVVLRADDAPTEGAAALDSDGARHGVHLLPETAVLRPGSDDLLLGGPVDRSGSGATPLARPGDAVAPLILGGFATRPAYDPVIGPEVRAARTRLGFSVDELADRTRIRPHVLEAIEVDDFAPSGGDVYARGHLRTLGRVLGKDAEVWVTQFDSRYAGGPTTAKRVFEAELASAVRPPRGPRSGPHWSLVAGVVLALGVVWAAATSLSDEPVEVVTPAPLVAPEAGQQAEMPVAAPVRTLQLRTGEEPASVTVRDADGAVVLVTALQPGETRRVRLALPVRVLVSEGGPVSLQYAGEARGQLAAPGVVVPGREGEAPLPSVRRLR